ncbi:hypothetical protein QN277_004065 [Acacia crassicarpa]|uniref:Uncharacterized protein n=1 Tax=Acacia crassicarpa TaxID=499986 RepID=A0AAE1MI08_9FABA|nr:hypothetical protein QN277_004065 [Acacia crassicarpa]
MTNVRKLSGPDVRSPVTLLLIVVPATIYVFVAWLLQHEHSSILVMTILFIISVLVILLLTSSRDPGIIPPEEDAGGRQTPRLQEEIPVYFAPDFSLPSQVSRGSIVAKVFRGEPGSPTATPKRPIRTLLFNSTRGFRDELIP